MSFKLGEVLGARAAPLARPCWRKERHATRGVAEAHMRHLLARGLEKDAARINAYECRHCGGWHVGHRKERA